MAANDSTTIIVKAKNETDAVFNKVKANLNETKVANDNMAMSVFKGVASWDLLKRGVSIATDFIKSSVQASIAAEREMAMVRQNVENAGIAYDTVKDKLDEYSKSMLQMGFDDEDTATSVSKLLLVTKDYNKALELNKLAADLARNKGIELSDATGIVTQVTAGNVRVLKQYGIVLKEGASAADALSAMHDKVKGSMEAFANTTEGKMQIMSVTWGNFKEQIGDIFGPALNVALTNFNNFLVATDSNASKWGDSISSKLAILVNPDTWKLTGKTVLTGLKQGAYEFGKFFVDVSDKIYGTKTKIEDSPIKKESQNIIDLANKIKQTTDVAEQFKNKIDETKPSFEGIGKAGEDAGKKSKDAMQGVIDKLKDFKQGIKDIQKAQEEESLAFIQSQIEKNQSFKQQLADMVKDHKDKWTQANKDREMIEKEGIKTAEDLQRVGELRATAEKEFAIIQPYLNDTEMGKLAATSDIERLITSHRAEQATETVDTAKRQAELVEKATNIYINFDLKDTTITDKNFIETVKNELNKSFNSIKIAY